MALSNEQLQQQLIQDLLVESFEGLDRFDRELLSLENGTSGQDTLHTIFRVIHTIKGTAGCIGLTQIEKVAHTGEGLLSLLRDGKRTLNGDVITTLLSLSDALRNLMRTLEASGKEGDADHRQLLERLVSLQRSGGQTQPPISPAPANPSSAQAAFPASQAPALAKDVSIDPGSFGLFEDEPSATSAMPARETSSAATLASVPETSHPVPIAATAVPAASADKPSAPTKLSVSDSSIRVDVGQLDKLMNLVGELVLARNQIVQFTTQSQEPALLSASQRLNIITTELQENVMKTRMQPIGNIWSKFPRIVRDVAHDLGKQVRLVMEGNETELDRTIIESIKDPLTHIVRNAIDHGIEDPATRRSHGKPEEGVLVLRAFHEGGQVNIEIIDDGAGINLARVKQKAIEKGVISSEQAARLAEREITNLIFLPGFSTAAKVTNVSGRGVGMDVVKTNVEKIGGSVDVQTEPGRSTTLKIKIPLTLAIIPALIVTSGGERFAIPQVSLLELVRLEEGAVAKGIETIYGAPVYRLRGKLLPLVYLNRELKLAPPAGANDDAVNIVVLQADGRQFGLVVDRINDTEEIVVKPLGKQLKGITCFAGATIMGDGRVALILDVLGLAQHAHVLSEVRERVITTETENTTETSGTGRQTLLLFNAGSGSRMAIPLSTVARLEEFSRASIERAGGRQVVQYRGQILPLLRVADYVAGAEGGSTTENSDKLQVVVYSEAGRSVGLVVDHINDIVEEAIVIKSDVVRQGILGSAVVQRRVTDLLDVASIIHAAAEDTHGVGSSLS